MNKYPQMDSLLQTVTNFHNYNLPPIVFIELKPLFKIVSLNQSDILLKLHMKSKWIFSINLSLNIIRLKAKKY